MRLAIISDLHANVVAFDAAVADAKACGADRVVCLGDIVDLGPQPDQIVERLRAQQIPCIRGNHDPLDEHSPVALLNEIRDWTANQLSNEAREFLDQLPERRTMDLNGVAVLCVHGSPRSDNDSILAETPAATLDAWCKDHEFDVLVAGHTHVQMVRRIDRRLFVNVGSVGQPFARAHEGPGAPEVLPWSEYALVTHDATGLNVALRRVHYDVEEHRRITRLSGMPNAEAWASQWPE